MIMTKYFLRCFIIFLLQIDTISLFAQDTIVRYNKVTAIDLSLQRAMDSIAFQIDKIEHRPYGEYNDYIATYIIFVDLFDTDSIETKGFSFVYERLLSVNTFESCLHSRYLVKTKYCHANIMENGIRKSIFFRENDSIERGKMCIVTGDCDYYFIFGSFDSTLLKKEENEYISLIYKKTSTHNFHYAPPCVRNWFSFIVRYNTYLYNIYTHDGNLLRKELSDGKLSGEVRIESNCYENKYEFERR